ncbi:hypothetical protein [Caulobacter sp. 17J80-11]|uniref:hypothetical protein n=1 Tax=Caulobacter sp. 17J80-11 TaxID=2763502 RepID=UPI0016537903|nr:hypothetical protein [Caulobacter sp. 17J80-11]MBC6981855.1 hypothetical protein [Caulobacter sp. 17J80-11]
MWNIRSLAAGAAVTAAAALLTGFAPAAPPAGDVCRLVDKAQMSRIIGKPVALAEAAADDGGPYCNYGVSDDGPFIRVSQLNGDWGQMVGELSDEAQETVADLGAAAVWTPDDYALLVRARNGKILRVSLDDDDKSLRSGDLKGVAVDIAKAALKSLGG